MKHKNKEIESENLVFNNAGELCLTDERKMLMWVKHYSKVLNIEFERPTHLLPEVAGDSPPVTSDQVCKALNKMKSSRDVSQPPR